MFSPVCKVLKKSGKFNAAMDALKSLEGKDVLVGIPAAESSRSPSALNNAELGFLMTQGVREGSMRSEMDAMQLKGSTYPEAHQAYIMSHGSPLWRVPPRPFLQPAITENKERVAKQQEKVLKAALNGSTTQVQAELVKLGLLGQNLAKGWFKDPRNNWPPNAPSTIARKGSDQPLIDTRKLRNSITYMVRDK